MKEADKRELARLVKVEIANGQSMTATVKRLRGMGFKQHTIRVYYKVFATNLI